MAKCDTGYGCAVCGEYVENITDSALYLRFILREVSLQQLFYAEEAHIRCLPGLACLIEHPDFDPVSPPAGGADDRLDPELVTRAWLRLQGLPGSGLDIPDYPLPLEN